MSLDIELKLLSSCVPNGKFWEAKDIDNSNLRRILTVFALENLITKNNIDGIAKELDIWSASEYSIGFWENLVGLPDNIFTTIPVSLTERINLVAFKLFGLKIRRKKDIIAFLEKLFPVLINSGWYITNGSSNKGFPFTFPFILQTHQDIGKNNIFVYLPASIYSNIFPFTFPFTFTQDISIQIKKVIEYIVPFTKTVHIMRIA